MTKHAGKIPVNARVTVDYSKEKPKVKFGYPDKDTFMLDPLTSLIVILVFMILFFLSCYFIVYSWQTDYVNYPANCNLSLGRYNYNWSMNWTMNDNSTYVNGSINQIRNFTVVCDNFNRTYLITPGYTNKLPIRDYFVKMTRWGFSINQELDGPIVYRALFIAILCYIIFFLGWIILFKTLKIILRKSKWYQAKMPYINSRISGHGYYTCFNEVPEDKIIKIPLFKNVELDYEAFGEFSDNLIKVEIKEHPFLDCLFKIKKHKGKEKYISLENTKVKKNVYLWEAKFYFKEIPKNGRLEVRFK